MTNVPDSVQIGLREPDSETSRATVPNPMVVKFEEAFKKSIGFKINCEPHNAPAVFFSKTTNKYKCLECLADEENLV